MDEACRTRLAEAAAGLLAAVPGRALAPADWHVTLCFLGAVDESLLAPLQAQAALIEASAFALHLARVAYWREARVVAAMADAPAAAALRLAEELRTRARALGLSPDEKPLRPHVTLMRVAARQALSASAVPRALAVDLNLQATEFQLLESRDAPARGTAPAQGTASQGTASQGTASVQGAASAQGTALIERRYVSLARWPLRP